MIDKDNPYSQAPAIDKQGQAISKNYTNQLWFEEPTTLTEKLSEYYQGL